MGHQIRIYIDMYQVAFWICLDLVLTLKESSLEDNVVSPYNRESHDTLEWLAIYMQDLY